MSSCACAAGFTGDAAASGGSCAVCTAGTYKSVMGSAVCTLCPSNAVSAEGGISCGCPVGFTWDAASGGSCTTCAAGTYISGMGSAECSSCPAGKYAATAGNTKCSTCPSGSSVSVTGSVAVTACICSLGYTGVDGGPCTGCGAGTYKDSVGAAECSSCPGGTHSAPGSDAAVDCVAAVSSITFSARVQKTQAEFEVEATTFAYILGVVTALGVGEASVSVVSVAEQSTGRRRKLLRTSAVVKTSVIVSIEQAQIVAGRITTENLNSALSSAGIFVDEISDISINGTAALPNSTVPGTADLPAWGIVVIAASGVALVAASVVMCVRSSRGSADDVSSQVSGSIGYVGKANDPEEGVSSDETVPRGAVEEGDAKERWDSISAYSTTTMINKHHVDMARDGPAGSPGGPFGDVLVGHA